MAKETKRSKANSEHVDSNKQYGLQEACEVVVKAGTAKFDESVDVAIRLGVDPKKADQNIRGSVALPHGLGKEVRIAVFAKGDKAEEAKSAGADLVGSDDLVKDVQAGKIEFDVVVATPDMMASIGKIGKVLGPRGLMPSPKVGTVTNDVAEIVKTIKSGLAEYKVDKDGTVHASIGKVSMGAKSLQENTEALLAAINKAKPQSSKGVYLMSAAISSTMGPGVAVNAAELR